MLTDTDVVFTEKEIDAFIVEIGLMGSRHKMFLCTMYTTATSLDCDAQVERVRLFGVENGLLDPEKQYAFEFPEYREREELGFHEDNLDYNQKKITLLKAYKQHIYGEQNV